MAKRFIDSTLFKKSFIRNIESKYKLFWIYLFCDCNHAGIWEVDYEIAQIYLGTKISAKEINEIFIEKLTFFDNNKKAFIKDFIVFQYSELSHTNMAHKNVIKELEKYGLYDSENKTFKELERGFEAPMQGAKEKEMVIEVEKEKTKKFSFFDALLSLGIEKEVADAWLKVRAKKKSVNSEIAFNAIASEIRKSKLSPNECAKLAAAKSWAGFESDWIKNSTTQTQSNKIEINPDTANNPNRLSFGI